MSDMIDGNMITLSRYEAEQARYEAENEKRIELIEWIIGLVEKIKVSLSDYDTDDLKNMANVIEEATEQLEDLIGKLEGER